MSDTHASEISPYHFIYLLIAVINDLLWRVLEVIKVSVDMINYGNSYENFTQTSPSEVIIASIVPICGGIVSVSTGILGLAWQKRQTFVNNHIECWVTELQVPDIHLMPCRKGCYRDLVWVTKDMRTLHFWSWFRVSLSHLLYTNRGILQRQRVSNAFRSHKEATYINVYDVLVSVVVHLLTS